MKEKKVIIVSGGTSGIGRASALALSRQGHVVYVLSRHQATIPGVVHVICDVEDEASVHEAVAFVMAREGHVDVLVNNAGFGISGAIEFTSIAQAQHQLDVNFFGMARLNREVLPLMRAQGKGTILTTSSVAGAVAIPFQAYYSASKAAIESYSDALRNEVRPYGIHVTAIRPGDIATGFTAAREKENAGDEAYGGRIGRSVKRMEEDERHGMSADKAGRAVARIALLHNPAPHYTIGFSYKLVSVAVKLLPARLANAIIGRMYAR